MKELSSRLCDSLKKEVADQATFHGHPRFYEILEELKSLHSRKNKDYASGGPALGNFQRRAQLYSMYPGLNLSDPVVVSIVDAMKQLDAALWLLCTSREGEVEGVADRLKDVAVYAVLAMILREEDTKESKKQDTIERIFPTQEEEQCPDKVEPTRSPQEELELLRG